MAHKEESSDNIKAMRHELIWQGSKSHLHHAFALCSEYAVHCIPFQKSRNEEPTGDGCHRKQIFFVLLRTQTLVDPFRSSASTIS